MLSCIISKSLAIVYDYKKRGDDWVDICKSGTKQSPINIKTTLTPEDEKILKNGDSMQAIMWYKHIANKRAD